MTYSENLKRRMQDKQNGSATKTAVSNGNEAISINFNPTEEQIEKISSIQTFVDTIIIHNDLSPNKNGFIRQNANDALYWRWVIVSVGKNFHFPVPIIEDENGNMNLYTYESKPISFSKDEAALVLMKYYILLFSYHNAASMESINENYLLNYAFSRANNWMNSIGGEKEMLRYLKVIDDKLMAEPMLYSKVSSVLD